MKGNKREREGETAAYSIHWMIDSKRNGVNMKIFFFRLL